MNINGTSDTKCTCGSWLQHWKNFSNQDLPFFCPEKSCIKDDLIGAHVQKANSFDKKWYIVPLCSDHNKSTNKNIVISNKIKLVSANKKETCNKI